MSNTFLNYKPAALNKVKGFGLIESLFALALFATVLLGIVMFYNSIQRKNEARELAAQTEAFARIFAKYMHDNYDELSRRWRSTPLTLNPYMLGEVWAIDIVKQNFYRQTPCVTIVTNPNTGIEEALMYYVGGRTFTSTEIIMTAVRQLGRSGGVIIDGKVLGNSGWGVMAGSDFLNNAAQCGGAIANNSLVVKLDLLEEWNQNLQPIMSINRGLDIGVANNILTLPGHILNTNTSKSNIYIANNKGVILDNYHNSLLKLGIQYNGQSTGAVMLGLGANSASLVADTIKPNLLGKAGDPCNYQEIGKVIADQGIQGDVISQILARNTLVCTQNDMLCAHANTSRTCYLSSVANQITFKNEVAGIQNTRGEFMCPASIPFLVRAEPGLSNRGSNQIGVYVTRGVALGEIRPANVNCLPPRGSNHPSNPVFCVSLLRNFLELGAPVAIIEPSRPDFFVQLNRLQPGIGVNISRNLNGYTTHVGYKINPLAPINLRSFLSNALNQIGKPNGCGEFQQNIETFTYQGIHYSSYRCMHSSGYSGMLVAVRTDDPNLHGFAIIKQATCSNSPLYVQN